MDEQEVMDEQAVNYLALGIFKREVFTDRNIASDDMDSMLPGIFLPLALMSSEDRNNFITMKPITLYAFMKDAAPRTLNGYPTFFNMYWLSKINSINVWSRYAEIVAATKTEVVSSG